MNTCSGITSQNRPCRNQVVTPGGRCGRCISPAGSDTGRGDISEPSMVGAATDLAFELHDGQVRKGTNVPYTEHLVEVRNLVAEYGGGDVEQAAAVLHDAVEDAGGPATLELIRDRFGDEVAEIVDECSDTDMEPKPPWRGRKEAYLEHMRGASSAATLVSACDRVNNGELMLAELDELGVDGFFDRVRADGSPLFNAGPSEQAWFFASYRDTVTKRLRSDGRGLLASRLESVMSKLVNRLDPDGQSAGM